MDMSLKDQLTTRELPGITQLVQVKDPRPPHAKLEQALQSLAQAEAGKDPAELTRRKTAATRARKAFDACFAKITLRALPPVEYEALIEKHPPTAEQIAEAGKDPADRPEFNDETFYPALLAACADGDMADEDWAEFLKRNVSRGERRHLYMAALAVNENERMPESMMLPKGSPGTGIWH